jgi:lipopolysaccharide/colanic/teichoic acid biosynthesis glycosyltransferase
MRNFAGAVQADDAERSYIANIMRPKLRMDMDYARTANAFSDLRLIGATAIFVVKHMMLRLVSGTTHE